MTESIPHPGRLRHRKTMIYPTDKPSGSGSEVPLFCGWKKRALSVTIRADSREKNSTAATH
jgi:hypothetical protein